MGILAEREKQSPGLQARDSPTHAPGVPPLDQAVPAPRLPPWAGTHRGGRAVLVPCTPSFVMAEKVESTPRLRAESSSNPACAGRRLRTDSSCHGSTAPLRPWVYRVHTGHKGSLPEEPPSHPHFTGDKARKAPQLGKATQRAGSLCPPWHPQSRPDLRGTGRAGEGGGVGQGCRGSTRSAPSSSQLSPLQVPGGRGWGRGLCEAQHGAGEH